MRRIGVVVLTTICLVPLACGDDDSGRDPAAERAEAREAVAAFEAAVADDGFVPAEDDDDEDDGLEFTSEECRELDELLSHDDDLAGETADEESRTFRRGRAASEEEIVQGSVTFADSGALSDQLETFADERTAPCIEEGLMNTFANQESEIDLELRDVAVSIEELDLGEGALQLHASAVIAAPGIEFPFELELLAVHSGRRGATVMTTGLGVEPGVDLPALAKLLLDPPTPA